MESKYSVKLSDNAFDDLGVSLEWGIENWGADRAGKWFDEMVQYIKLRLSTIPLAYSIAPESLEFDQEVRHLIAGRYRVLFLIKDPDVLVIRIVGAFMNQSDKSQK